MTECIFCGNEVDVSYARRVCGRKYGAGIYDEYYPDGDVCASCAASNMSADYAAGGELKELMHWDDD